MAFFSYLACMLALLLILPFLLAYTVVAVYAERKVSAFMQDRLGPHLVGKYGLLQTIADLLKLLQKEDVKNAVSLKTLFSLAPVIVFVAIFSGFTVLPIAPGLQGSSIATGIYLLLALISLDVVGILLAGWASGNKFSFYGAARSVSQVLAYEIPLVLSVVAVALLFGTMDLGAITAAQDGGLTHWSIFQHPVLLPVMLLFFISSLAEANRAPFDLPESESELIGGFHTEYSGFRWAMLMLAEYGAMLLMALLGVILFWGGYQSPLPSTWEALLPSPLAPLMGIFWLLSKTAIWVFIQMWARWTYPRLRVDQVMLMNWKYLIPASFFMLLMVAVLQLL